MELRTAGEVQVRVDATPETVYGVVADVTRTGEWSPECRRCAWIGDATHATPGARFRGWNRSGIVRWSRLVEVVTATPGRELAFRTLPDRLNKDSTLWRYRLEEDEGGTLLTHGYEIEAPPRFPVSLVTRTLMRHHADMRPQIARSLERVKAIAEREAGERDRPPTP
ncbi:MAG: SRPBCC family protein [Acidimicrobiia bacterium]|nr:SRPBCC family protein [Acidimicrobiia bacterium]